MPRVCKERVTYGKDHLAICSCGGKQFYVAVDHKEYYQPTVLKCVACGKVAYA